MNRQCLMTVVSADMYQHYIGPFIMCARGWAGSPIDIRIYVRGPLDAITEECLMILDQYGVSNSDRDTILENKFLDYPNSVSATNTLRFLHEDDVLNQYAQVMILDVDLLLFSNLFQWHLSIANGQPFAGHHGPWKKPHRPEIAPSWSGAFERVSGGFFMVTKEWWERTREQREYQKHDLMHGRIGNFRESDEVTLGRIIKGSGMKVPSSKHFPTELRGVHLGDFKPSMDHRWQNMAKMVGKLTTDNCWAFVRLEQQPAWQDMMKLLEKDDGITHIIGNVRTHLGERGIL